MKKRIGISFSTLQLHNYWNWFTPEELQQVELFELSYQTDNTADIATCDGFLLTGGDDIDPAYYGKGDNYPNRPPSFHSYRDYFETAIFNYAQTHNKPLLGICRGLQLINVICKGSLIMDLGDDTLNKTHRGEPDKVHPVIAERDTLLFDITGNEKEMVNSAHHQAIETVGEGLMINCRSEDGVMEGIEWSNKTGKPFMLAVQWHPERMSDKEQNAFSINLKKRFLEEVVRQKNSP